MAKDMMQLQEARQKLEQLKGKKDRIEDDIFHLKCDIELKKSHIMETEKALEIVKTVGLKTQQTLQFHISDTVSAALESVFPEPYQFGVEFVQRRNKTECDLSFVRGGEAMNPLEASGGGAVDVASFALRIASWTMQSPRSRSVLFLDEPFRYLSEGLLPLAGQMVKRISDQLNLQIVMVTHSEALMEHADKTFTVTQRKGISKVF